MTSPQAIEVSWPLQRSIVCPCSGSPSGWKGSPQSIPTEAQDDGASSQDRRQCLTQRHWSCW